MKSIVLLIFLICNLANVFASPAQVIHVLSPEVRGLLGTGGLQHAVLDKAKYMQAQGHEVKIIMPFYSTMESLALTNIEVIATNIDVPMNNGAAVFTTDIIEFSHPENEKIKIVGVKHKPGKGFGNMFNNITPDGSITYSMHANQGEVFSYYAKAYTEWMNQAARGLQPDIVVLNDWHTGVAAAYLQERKDTKLKAIAEKKLSPMAHKIPVVQGVIHNLKYQGVYGHELFAWLGLDQKYFNAMDMHGNINFLKTMMELSDYVETVSMNYAKEITTARFGEGLESITSRLAATGRLSGLINGIDTEKWDSSKTMIADPDFKELGFSTEDFGNKEKGKQKIIKKFFNTESPNSLVIALTARMDDQKGYSFLAGDNGVFEKILANDKLDIKFVITGDPHGVRENSPIVQDLAKLQEKYPHKISVNKFNPELERIFLYFSDMYLGASVFEPSGLSQMFSQSVGTVPVISRVGGHVDSVEHGKSGLLFDLAYEDGKLDRTKTVNHVVQALEEADKLYRDKAKFNQLRQSMMAINNSWAQRISYFQNFLDLASIGFFKDFKQDLRNPEKTPLNLRSVHKRLDAKGAFCFRYYTPAIGL